MKKIIYSIMATTLIILSCTQEEKSPVEGTWQYASSITIAPDTVVNSASENDSGIWLLMIGEKHFSTIWQEEPKDELDLYYEGFDFGTYTYIDGIYSESSMYSTVPGMNNGPNLEYITEFKGDTMFWTVIQDSPDDTIAGSVVWIRFK